MIMDSHAHVWSLVRGDYDWLTPDQAALYRDVTIAEVVAKATACGVEQLILVQAAPTVAETAFLLNIADMTPAVAGVVGWIDFAARDLAALERVAVNRLLVGLRPMLQDDSKAAETIARAADPLLAAMTGHALVFDALVRAQQLPLVTELAARHPTLAIVLDHGGKPRLNGPDLCDWCDDIRALAAHANVSVKLSGLMTEALPGSTDRVVAALRVLLEEFGPGRCLWGSDWPVLGVSGDYEQWYRLVRSVVEAWGGDATRAVFGDNARRLYRVRRH